MGLPKLPYVDLLNFKGLFTKSSPDVLEAEQLRIAENCDFFETYGALTKIKGNDRILSTQYKESGTVKKIPWIDFYKASDLDGQILRHTLVAAGTILGRIDGSSITTLCTGRTEDLFHSSDQHDRFMYITNQNPDLVGNGDQLVKYDGAVMTNWGITAPGSTETVRESFDTASDFDTKPSAQFTISNDTTVTWDGGTSLKIDKTGTTHRLFYIEKKLDDQFYVSSDVRDLSKHAANRVSFFTYIPRGQLTADKIDSSSFNTGEASMAVWVSPDGDSVERNHWKFYFSIGQLVEGWNKLNLDFSGAPVGPKGQFYPEVDTIKRVRWDFRLDDESHTRTGIRLDRMISYDEGNLIASASGVGTLTGDYQYVVTYVSKYGNESNAGPASSTVTASNNAQLDLTNIPTSDDPQVIARNIYRTVAGGSIFLFLTRLNNNRIESYTDTTPDGSLGNTTPPQVGDFSDDNSPPPKAGIFKVWKDTGFLAGDPQNPNSLFFSEVNELESWPLINEFVLDDKITAIYETYSTLIVETETGKWQVLGDNPDFAVDKLVDNIGCVGRRAAGKSRTIGYAVDKDGMRLFDGNNTSKISEPIRDKYDTLEKSNIELMHTGHTRTRNMILQFNPDETTPIPTYDSVFAYQYSIDNVTQGYWTTLELPSTLNILDTAEIEDSNGDFHLYASDDNGMVYELFKSGQLNWTSATGSTSAIRTRFQTPYLRLGDQLGEAFSGRVQPRYIEIRTKENTAINWTVTIESADGPSQESARDSQEITLEFGTNNSLIRQALKPNFHPGDYVRITVDNNEKDVDCQITGIRIFVQIHPFQGQVISVDNV